MVHLLHIHLSLLSQSKQHFVWNSHLHLHHPGAAVTIEVQPNRDLQSSHSLSTIQQSTSVSLPHGQLESISLSQHYGVTEVFRAIRA